MPRSRMRWGGKKLMFTESQQLWDVSQTCKYRQPVESGLTTTTATTLPQCFTIGIAKPDNRRG
jgi:hypothetical protein